MSLDIYFSDISKIEADASYDENFMIDRISTDTRSISRGETYLAIEGACFDGHDYIDDAISSGASSVVISRRDMSVEKPSLKVSNTVVTLGNIARLYRNKLGAKVIGITGSNGKTTVKGMMACIGEAYGGVTVTRANQNNTIGVPLTLLSASKQDKVIVVELGTSESGEIAYLSRMVSPDISIINNISESHLEGIGVKDDVFHEKSEIIRFTRPQGSVILNADDDYTEMAKKLAGGRKVLTFGLENEADILAEYERIDAGSLVHVTMPKGIISYRLNVPGKHNVANSLAAVAVAHAAHIGHAQIIKGLENFTGAQGRLRVSSLGRESWLIDDSYNANPSSTHAALDVLSDYPGRKIFVYGGMVELGLNSPGFHQDIGHKASDIGVDAMYVLSGEASAALDVFENEKYSFKNIDDMCKSLLNDLRDGDAILVKGSRRYKMDRVVKYLQEAMR